MQLKDICCACLSLERKLSPLNYISEGVTDICNLIFNHSELNQAVIDASHFHICWECGALLRRLHNFQKQVFVAQYQLSELVNDTYNINKEIECLSKLSYKYKRSLDKEIVYIDMVNKHDDSDDDIAVDIKTDDCEPKTEIKIEPDNKDNKEIANNPFSDLNIENNIKKEIKNPNNDTFMKCESKVTDSGDEDNFYIADLIINKAEKRKLVVKQKINNTAKRKSAAKVVKKNNVRKAQEDPQEENNKIKKGASILKTRQSRKVENLNSKQDPNNYPCTDCDQVFTTYTRRYEHIMKYHKEGYQCATCGKKFHIKKSFLRHERVHIAKTLPREKCSTCGLQVRCDLVQQHAARHAARHAAQRALFECAACDKRFANRNSYKKHMSEAKAHVARDDKKYSCETCHKSFPTLLLYNCHMRYTKRHAVQAAVYRYKCSMCEKSYRNPAALRDHVNYVHMGKTQHKCTLCDKALASPQCVARHMKLFHGGHKYPKNKLCDSCGKAFSSKKELREHESVHTGERPLKCDVCGDTFRQSGALYTHKRRVHKVPLKPAVQLVSEPDDLVEQLVLNCELDETDLVINRAINVKKQ